MRVPPGLSRYSDESRREYMRPTLSSQITRRKQIVEDFFAPLTPFCMPRPLARWMMRHTLTAWVHLVLVEIWYVIPLTKSRLRHK